MTFSTLAEWLAWQETLNPAEIDLGLERIEQVMHQAGLPDRFACPLIMVAGTNGKGSVAAAMQAIATEAGYRVGSYTSPHLLRYNERICIDGEPVSDADLCDAFARIDRARGAIALTYFEFGTLAAIDLFHRAQLDLVVMEIGLGGRLDAVNVMQPDVSVITSIALDHTDWLGDSREQIAAEKAGVMRPGRPVVIGDAEPPPTLAQQAQQLGANALFIGQDYAAERHADSWLLHTGNRVMDALPMPALPGEHQLGNAATAIVALQQLAETLPVSEEAIRSALPKVSLPGRFQRLRQNPEVIADVAHNPQALAALAAQCQQQPAAGETHVVLGMLADKPVEQVAESLSQVAQHWHLVDLQHVGRGLSAAQLRARLEPALPGVKLHTHASVEQAWRALQAGAAAHDRVLVTGSFYVVADALQALAAPDHINNHQSEKH